MKFRYTARDEKRLVRSGVIEADTAKIVVATLQERKLTPVAISPVQSWQDLGSSFYRWRKVSDVEVTNFTRQLATMITAGLPITDGLNLLRLQSSSAFSPVVAAILANVQGGVSLSDSLVQHPQVFSKVYVALVKAGEAAGVLETILNRLADTLERGREFNAKVKGAMIYPAIIVIGMVVVVAIMMIVVIPKLTSLYADFGAELPFATKVIVAMSNLATHFWWAVIIVGGGIGYGLRWYILQPTGRRQWDAATFRIPIVGKLVQQVLITELTRTLALLVGAGVSVVEALNIVADAMNNLPVQEAVHKIAKKVEKGFPLSVCFADDPLFPPMLGQMVAVGEETGKMDEVLAKLANFYETESDHQIKALTTAIEPIIIVVLGAGVGFLMFAVIMPIYNLTNNF